MTISFEQAERLALERVAALGASVGEKFVLMEEETLEEGDGWLFFYNSKDFVETRDPVSALAGNGPIFVDRSGLVETLPTSIPWEVALEQLRTLRSRHG